MSIQAQIEEKRTKILLYEKHQTRVSREIKAIQARLQDETEAHWNCTEEILDSQRRRCRFPGQNGDDVPGS